MCKFVSFCDKFGKVGMLSVLVVFLGVFLFSIVGCEQTPPPPSPIKVEKTEPPPPTEEEPEEEEGEEEQVQEPEPEYGYDPSGRREPFKSLVAEEIPEVEDVIVVPTPKVVETPLQKFDVNQLRLTGIILGSYGEYAKVEAPDGKSYTIKLGTLVGKQDGEVITITDNVIVVKEVIRYESGKVEEVETPLYLNPIDEEES